METSGKWPAAIHGLFVMSTSPSSNVSTGYSASRCPAVFGSVTVNNGVLKVDCATDSPLTSSMTQAKSRDSPTMVENDVRTTAASTSSMMVIRRCH